MGKNRSSNMEKYYGFSIRVENFIDPVREEAAKIIVKERFSEENIRREDYLVYFHSIIIIPIREHFGFLNGLSERAEEISIHYNVNQKQIKSGNIKFLNYYFEGIENTDIIHQYSDTSMIGFNIKSSYFERNPQFLSYIVTFIHQDLRPDHRKIKLSVSARPTMRYRSVVSREYLIKNTMKDLRYDKPIQLGFPGSKSESLPAGSEDMIEGKRGPTSVNITGPVGTVNVNSGGDIFSGNDVTVSDVVNDLRKLSGYLSSLDSSDEKMLQTVEEAIVASRRENSSHFFDIIKRGGVKLAGYAEKIGLEALELYVKRQIEQ